MVIYLSIKECDIMLDLKKEKVFLKSYKPLEPWSVEISQRIFFYKNTSNKNIKASLKYNIIKELLTES